MVVGGNKKTNLSGIINTLQTLEMAQANPPGGSLPISTTNPFGKHHANNPPPQGTAGVPPYATRGLNIPLSAQPELNPLTHTTPTGSACSLAQKAAATPDISITALPELCVLLKAISGTTSQSQIEQLETLPLTELPPLVIYVYTPNTHIQVLWG